MILIAPVRATTETFISQNLQMQVVILSYGVVAYL